MIMVARASQTTNLPTNQTPFHLSIISCQRDERLAMGDREKTDWVAYNELKLAIQAAAAADVFWAWAQPEVESESVCWNSSVARRRHRSGIWRINGMLNRIMRADFCSKLLEELAEISDSPGEAEEVATSLTGWSTIPTNQTKFKLSATILAPHKTGGGHVCWFQVFSRWAEPPSLILNSLW